ncbi:hypothetical protein STSP2_01603 [Anaerohalosphaera lusitana]|uniref:Uncharacterized protein n=1 Tax=Anaerohalosphaera lusitana TaxID=1936003 RepID=A0A1U9NKK6_9BACT|nr:hypothetical protein STSP2_01603 [Anaerohalosphaera lusitana]
MSLLRFTIVLFFWCGWVIFPCAGFWVGHLLDNLFSSHQKIFRKVGILIGFVAYTIYVWYGAIEKGFAHLFA